MAGLLHPQSHYHFERSSIQNVSLGAGIFFVITALTGLLNPEFLRMHLSTFQNLIFLLIGSSAILCGFGGHQSAKYFCLTAGVFFLLLGAAGFLIGRPGYPGVGYLAADQNLFRIVPNVLEYGTLDHYVHILISVVLLYGAFRWIYHQREKKI